MKLLVAVAQPRVERLAAQLPGYIGRLVGPRDCGTLDRLEASGLPWAADNDAFSGFHEERWLRMLDKIAGREGCLFVTAPDVVSDHARTLELWHRWAPVIRDAGLLPAFVLQDGVDEIPDTSALFVGGSTLFKLGDVARSFVEGFQGHVHMGRVNTIRRLRYAASIGVDSVDGYNWSRFSDTKRHMLEILPYAQLALTGKEQE